MFAENHLQIPHSGQALHNDWLNQNHHYLWRRHTGIATELPKLVTCPLDTYSDISNHSCLYSDGFFSIMYHNFFLYISQNWLLLFQHAYSNMLGLKKPKNQIINLDSWLSLLLMHSFNVLHWTNSIFELDLVSGKEIRMLCVIWVRTNKTFCCCLWVISIHLKNHLVR